MIRASCGGAHLTVRGHAGYGEYGKDIVCAAASALVYALAGRLRETGRLERFQSAPGYAEIAGTGDCAREFALVRCGLGLLARQYIRTGIVYYDGAAPVYGVAVGQDLTCREVDGEKVVEQNNFRAVFTATRLSFWQDATEVAYVSNNRLYITNITVLGGIDVGQWSMEAAEGGLAFRWIGG